MSKSSAIIARLRAHASPTVQLRAATGDSPSRLGGSPDLPEGFEWPRSPQGNLAFVAQLDLAHLNGDGRVEHLPREGRVLLFYDARESADGSRPGDRAHWRVVYIEPAAIPTLRRAALPADLPREFLDYREISVAPYPIETTPREWRLDPPVDPETLSDDDCQALDRFALEPYGGLPRHQLGGHPFPESSDTMDFDCQIVSNGIALEDAKRPEDPKIVALFEDSPRWRLLLQLDSDPLGGMSWGHRGLLYVWVPEESAREGRFDDAWVMVQSELD